MTQLRVLVAEDDVLVAEDLREALEEMRHVVAAVLHSSDDVVPVAREEDVDLALLEIRMPGKMDGVDAGRRLRGRVVHLTASIGSPSAEAGRSPPRSSSIPPTWPCMPPSATAEIDTGCSSPRKALPADFVMSVNFSAFQLSDLGLEEGVTRILRAHGVPPEMLMIEIVQEELLQALRLVRAFRNRGIRVAVDDFGTGLSRFSHFRRLEVDALKLDRSFVAGLGEDGADAAIARRVVVLAEGLGFDVVAERMETAVQRNELRSLGCSLGQGFYFSRPLQPRDFRDFLEESREGVIAAGD